MEFNEEEFSVLYNIKDQIEYIESYQNIDWNLVLKNNSLTDEFLNEYFNSLNIGELESYQNLSENFMLKHKKELNWISLGSEQNFSNEFFLSNRELFSEDVIRAIVSYNYSSSEIISEFVKNTDEDDIKREVWKHINTARNLTDKFMEEYKNKLDWRDISIFQDLDEESIDKFKDKLDWREIVKNQKLSQEFIEKHIKKIDFRVLIENQKISEKLIKKILSKIKGKIKESRFELIESHIFEYQNLSEEFIEKYKDKSSSLMEVISIYQDLSEEFIEKHIDEFKIFHLIKYQKLSMKIINENIIGNTSKDDGKNNQLIIKELFENQTLSEEFIQNNLNYYKENCEDTNGLLIKKLSDKDMMSNINEIDWEHLIKNVKFSNKFFKWYVENEVYETVNNSSRAYKRFDEEKMNMILEYQDISEKNIKYFSKDMDFSRIVGNKNIKEKTLKNIKEKLDLKKVVKVRKKAYGDNEDINLKLKKNYRENYLRFYKVYNGDREYLIKNNIQVDSSVERLISSMEKINESIFDKIYEDKGFDTISKYVRGKEQIIIRREQIKKSKEKMKKIKKINEVKIEDSEMVF